KDGRPVHVGGDVLDVVAKRGVEARFERPPPGAGRCGVQAGEESDLAEVMSRVDEFVEMTEVVKRECERVFVGSGIRAVRQERYAPRSARLQSQYLPR